MMRKHTQTVTVQKGETLFDALCKMNMVLDRPCGGTGVCGLCKVEVEKFGAVKACQFRIPGTFLVTMTQNQSFGVINSGTNFYTDSPIVGIDIGTTTVAWKILYKDKQQSGGFVNPQRMYGADVLSRIKQATEGKAFDMQKIITDSMKVEIQKGMELIWNECESEGSVCPKTQIYIVGNTTMLHLLNGWDCTGLGKKPFAPVSLATKVDEIDKATITQLPGVSAFIGADIVSGIFSVQMHRAKAISLFIDLGTNGEMAIGGKGYLLATSTAAGPAFEASELALAIHASGIMKAFHKMRMKEVMDENGLLSDAYFTTGYSYENQVITQDFIREIQMAKAAIRAGIEILMKEYQVAENEIEQVYLAGGMGYFMNPEDAIAIGLFPQSFAGKVKSVGNTGLDGAILFAKETDSAKQDIDDIVRNTQEVLLADHPDFEALYIQHMSFPQ